MIEPRYDVLEKVVIHGDLAKLSPEERVAYYARVCESLGLNPLTRPIDYILLNGRLTLYANRSAADQLRNLHGISIEIVSQQQVGDLYVVHVRARDREGRVDEDLGVVPIKGLSGDALANAILKAITKAKRRVTLSIAGLGWLDETETETIPGAQPVQAELPRPDADRLRARGQRVLDRMSERERQQGVPFDVQMRWLIDRGALGAEAAQLYEQGALDEETLLVALGAVPDAILRELGAFCDRFQAGR
jgi:hypothetical protein